VTYLERGSGATTRQMQKSPKFSVYVWCNRSLYYPISLAKAIGREDLKIVSPSWLDDRRWLGIKLYGLVIDHAAKMTSKQYDSYYLALTRIERNSHDNIS